MDIKHYTKELPGIVRCEYYEYEDLKYIETFDPLDGKRMYGDVEMYNGVPVCTVGADGRILLHIPLGWVHDHESMMDLMSDIKRLDEFLAAVCENYK